MISNTLCLCDSCNSVIFITELYLHKCINNNYTNKLKKKIKQEINKEINKEININTENNKYLN